MEQLSDNSTGSPELPEAVWDWAAALVAQSLVEDELGVEKGQRLGVQGYCEYLDRGQSECHIYLAEGIDTSDKDLYPDEIEGVKVVYEEVGELPPTFRESNLSRL